MISIINGNIFNSNADIICHQVNCKGVMNSGLAKEMRNIYPEVYREYVKTCDEYYYNQELLLGKILYVNFSNVQIANLFAQCDYGRDKQYTDYNSLAKCLKLLYMQNNTNCKSIAFPYKIGCGLGGGDWNIVFEMIERAFKDYAGTIEIWKLN